MARSLSFVLFSPDATATRRHEAAIARFTALGVSFAAFRWVRLTPDLTRTLYDENRRQRPDAWGDSLVDRLFAMDFSLAALVASDTMDTRELCALLAAAKGPSNPFAARPLHLRRQLGASNKIMNFLHTSDDPDRAAAEAGAVLGEAAAAAAAAAPARTGPHPAPCAGLGRESSLFGPARLLALKERLLHAAQGGVDGELARAMRRERALIERHGTVAVFGEGLRDLHERQVEILERRAPLPPHVRGLFRALCRLPRDAGAASRLSADLRRAGAEVSPWDELVLHCEAFQSRSAAHRPGLSRHDA